MTHSEIEDEASAKKAAETVAPSRVVAIVVNPDGTFTLNQAGVETMSIPSLLRVVANDVERQLGI
jgi:hypothetical protein